MPHLAVASINRDKYSETFIHDSFDFFPCRKTLLYGDYLPTHFCSEWRQAGEPIPSAKPPFYLRQPATTGAQAAYNLKVWLRSQRVDVVLAHYGPGGVAVMEVCEQLKLPLVVHFHGYDAYRSDILSHQGKVYPALFARAAALVVVSGDMHRQLERLGAPAEKMVLCRYGVSVPSTPPPLPSGPLQFLFVGRLVPKKSPDLMLRAFASVVPAMPETKLTLVGDGELMETCRALIQELQLEAHVELTGALPRAEVAARMAAAHVLVAPSRRGADGDAEGTPLVVMEAAAAGRAVIGTRHAGIPEVVTDGETGLLVPEGDIEALAGAMLRLAGDRARAQQCGANGHARALRDFVQADYHQKLWQLLCKAGKLSQNP